MTPIPAHRLVAVRQFLNASETMWAQHHAAERHDPAEAHRMLWLALELERNAGVAADLPLWAPTRKPPSEPPREPTRKEVPAMTDSPTPLNLAAVAMRAASRDPTARHRRDRAEFDIPAMPQRPDPSRLAETSLGYRMLDITLPRRRPLWKRLLRVA